ncbi:hypothetical protein ACFSUS_15525 [Spirosoma soli]|uniref:Uncharacterized protein n=1 Tax=Spirosoma soli TaxID=1770529 RepID=A0ABW5M6S2_9BACT
MSSPIYLNWLDIVEVTSADEASSIAAFPNLKQACDYAQLRNAEQADMYQIVTNKEDFFWVVSSKMAEQLLLHGFKVLSLP